MSKGLLALKDFRDHYFFERDEEENLNAIEKELMAFEIIRRKQVNISNLISYPLVSDASYETYCDDFNYNHNYFELGLELLTKEEYYLLKDLLLYKFI